MRVARWVVAVVGFAIMPHMTLLRELWEDVKAWRRGERRVLPRGSRGRVYARKSGEVAGPNVAPAARPRATFKAVVIRKDGTREEI